MTAPCLGEMASPVADATPTATVRTSHQRHEPTLNTTRGGRVIVAATVAVGTGLMIVVGLDGSPAWQLLRLVLVAAVTAATYNALRHGDARRRAGVAFSVGLVGTTVGAGIGLPHLAKAGAHLLTVAGLFSLAGGLVLLTWGGVALVRSARPWSRVLVVPTLLVAVFVVMWSVSQAVAVTNSPPTSVGDTTPADIGLRYHDVEFETIDGVTLSGWYLPSSNGAAVVLLHGAGSTRSSVLDHAARARPPWLRGA